MSECKVAIKETQTINIHQCVKCEHVWTMLFSYAALEPDDILGSLWTNVESKTNVHLAARAI